MAVTKVLVSIVLLHDDGTREATEVQVSVGDDVLRPHYVSDAVVNAVSRLPIPDGNIEHVLEFVQKTAWQRRNTMFPGSGGLPCDTPEVM